MLEGRREKFLCKDTTGLQALDMKTPAKRYCISPKINFCAACLCGLLWLVTLQNNTQKGPYQGEANYPAMGLIELIWPHLESVTKYRQLTSSWRKCLGQYPISGVGVVEIL